MRRIVLSTLVAVGLGVAWVSAQSATPASPQSVVGAPFPGGAVPPIVALADPCVVARVPVCHVRPSATFARVVLADTPIGYWRMDAASGTIEKDQSGNWHDGTITGGVTLNQAGAIADGDAAELFDGLSGAISVADNAAFHVSAITLEAWVMFTPAATAVIVQKGIGNTTTGGLFVAGSNNKKLQFTANDAVHSFTLNSTNDYNDGHAHHVVGTYDGTTATLYVDGASVASNGSSGLTLPTDTHSLSIGADVRVSTYFTGTIDEVALYNVALSASQVANHYANRLLTNTIVVH